MRLRPFASIATGLCFFILTAVVSAGTSGIGNPTMRVAVGANSQTAVIFADAITNGGQAGNGAISWDIYFTVPSSVGLADFTVTAGPVWSNQCPGLFSVAKTAQGTVNGQNAFYISGFCSSTRTGPPVTGSNVEVATLVFNTTCATTGTFNVNLDVGPTGDWTDMFDTSNELHIFTASALTDGPPQCVPTGVTLANFSALAQPDHVLVTWETVSELNNAGFNLYRDTSPVGPGVQVNSALIASQGPGGTGGFSYSWQDFDAPTSTSLYYWLESVDFNGSTSRYGPVSVEPVAPTAVGLNSFAAQATASGWPLWPAGIAALAAVTLTVRRLKRSRRAER